MCGPSAFFRQATQGLEQSCIPGNDLLLLFQFLILTHPYSLLVFKMDKYDDGVENETK